MYEHSETELFKEIIHFMDISFPEWKTNKGLGTSATEFILHCIDFLSQCTLEKRDNEFNSESLTILYLSLAEDYERFKTEYQFIFLDFVLEKFTNEFDEDLEDEHLTDYRYNDLYENFLNKELEKVTYDFI
ncbi:hypothetical protein SAMN05444484_10572 [Flavobacterium chilense]|uniref:Uncharacterized protein n=2 Tax=Flavobacterium chilense TaxID=946677 RepID=A0A1M7HQ55_9FLAO|nr:hypothetical protein SAMN05444484_10572 [Flavobacterium chilense]